MLFVEPDYWSKAKRALSRRDPVMRAIIQRHPDVALRSRGDAFITLARSIVGQQISLKAADTVWRNVTLLLPDLTPKTLQQVGAKKLARCGLSQRKSEYLVDLARHFSQDLLRSQHWLQMSDEEVIADLIQVRGIGRWTAEMFLIFNLLRPNVLPVADIGLQRAVSLHYRAGQPISISEIKAVGENWRPWCSVATWYLWRSLDPVPVEY